MDNSQYLTIQALTKYIKRKFDKDPHLSGIYVKGEISNFKRHSSGHMYFTLKDERARILAVMFSSANASMKFNPENGMNVLVRGDISVYESGGQYQIYVKEMQPDGIGDLFLAYQQLKEKLEKQGLFSEGRKKPIPKFPRKIGVITSPTGAAVRDIITTIERRYPIGEIVVYPALVQGERAAQSIAESIKKANKNEEIDVLIVGRGGGSIEELWAFNEERVALAISNSEVPVISAVGHETDFTIADFAADMRAPTPTAAAELAVPHIDDLLERVLNQKIMLIRGMKTRLKSERARLKSVTSSIIFRNPRRLYEQKIEAVDYLTEKLNRNQRVRMQAGREILGHLDSNLKRVHPRRLWEQKNEQHLRTAKQLQTNFSTILRQKQNDFSRTISTLEALSPLKIMDRGYSLVYSKDVKLVKSKDAVNEGEKVTVHLQDGKLHCHIDSIEESEK
ncbi:exodeoxyribonuclease VII large subunit [Rossellomorea vietnamensis]|uniref:Exodeoxyribonuclease 7 large subunit n=1 Tax=Rossellomorea vietnamensis TaxID=218284 RepID=A0A5D4KH82_9BACI|nr:exodeoxyribonuclease VII large subunit [Rossellomorea vietnamensis]TYR76316.1 exodeoxyribonuclease VII large subunit [Rossellomorea vietnamensis]